MIVTSPTTYGVTASREESTTTTNKTKADLGKEDFITLLLAQLKHQDPMNPMENADFTAQMAQFSSLEQLININEGLNALTTAANATNTAQAMNLIGKEVKAEGHNVHVKNGVATDLTFELPDAAANVVINIQDQYGNSVRSIERQTLSPGVQQIEWDGKSDVGAPLEDGLYQYSVLAYDIDGNVMNVATFTRGIVNAVSFENGVGYAHIGEQKYMLSEILEVREPRQEPSTSSDTNNDEEDTESA